MCCPEWTWNEQKATQVKENIQALKDAGAQIIIVNFHWGIEKEYTPNATQKKLAHLAVDEGADLVIGHHPHVLEGIEKYNGKYIAYSLGNFCFGGNKNPSDKDTMIFQQTFTIDTDGKVADDDLDADGTNEQGHERSTQSFLVLCLLPVIKTITVRHLLKVMKQNASDKR